MDEPYLYDGLEASLYDQLDELSDFEDVAFYLEIASATVGRILDLGCGTGRVLIPLLESGFEVVGLEYSPQMLALCRARLARRDLEAELVRGDMRDFELGESRFGAIMIPGFSAQLLLDDADLIACLARCREHLLPGGRLVVPCYQPWEMIWDSEDEQFLEERRRKPANDAGEIWVAYQGWKLDRLKQRLLLTNRIERQAADGSTLQSEEKGMTLRWDSPHEMLSLFGKAGFGDVELFGDFTFEPPEADSESIVYVARV